MPQWHGTNCVGTPVYGTAILFKIIALCVYDAYEWNQQMHYNFPIVY